MKKSVLSLLICLVCAFTAMFAVGSVASAQAVNTEALLEAIARAPDKAVWDDYIDVSLLSSYMDDALVLLAEDNPPQSLIDSCAARLNKAIDDLQLHTKSVSLNMTSLTLPANSEATLIASLLPDKAADPVSWTSSKPAAVSVSAAGVVKALKYSAEPVTVAVVSNGHRAECTVTVTNPVSGVKLESAASVYKTRTVQLNATAYGADSSAPTTDEVSWEWRSSNTSVATVTTTGCVTGVSSGTCTITAYAISGSDTYSADCTLSVNDFVPIKSLTPIAASPTAGLDITAGDSAVYRIGILPANATEKTIKWSTSDSSVATVTAGAVTNSISTATIHAVKEGTVRIYYAATDGSGISGSVAVTVAPQISSITISETTAVINVGQTKQLTVTIIPANAGNQLLTWTSSDSSVCSVDYKGNLTARQLGVCTISADTSDGSGLQVRCNVRVASKASAIEVSPAALALDTDEGYSLNATVTTVDGTMYISSAEVDWSSSNTTVARVSSAGYVKAYQSGSAVITATAKDGSGVKGACTVTVTSPVKGISIAKTLKLKAAQTHTLTPTFTPAYATNKNVTWKSSDTNVATVDASGKVTARTIGSAVITCTSEDGGYTATCAVAVIVPVESISLGLGTLRLNVGSIYTIPATVLPANATDKTLTWKSSNTAVATVSSAGLVTSVKAGTAEITATSSDGGSTATCTVTCIQKVTGLTLDKLTLSLYEGQVRSLTATVFPGDASNKSVYFMSSDDTVASIDVNGVITAKKIGVVTITAISADGGFTAACSVSVTGKIPVTAFSFGKTAVEVGVGDTFGLEPLVLPSDASEKRVSYKSNNTAVATVSSAGIVTAKGPGSAVITGATVDGNITATCKVSVVQLVSGISISEESYSVYVGKTFALSYTITPSNASNKNVTWSSDNNSVAIVSSTGVVKGMAPGSCLITCYTADGGFTAGCSVTVKRAATGINLNRTTLKIAKGEGALLTASVLPADATDQTVKWSTSNRLVANISSAGKVTAGMAGTATITCTSNDGGFKASCTVTVYQPVTSLTMSAASVKLDAGKYKTLSVTVAPDNATTKTVTWKSMNTAVATVDSKGKVTAVAEGTARIVASSADGYCSAYCTVTVSQPPTKVTLSATTLRINVGSSATLKATVLPINAYNKSVKWSSSDTAVATVTQNGVVTARKAGTATISCTTLAGNRVGTASVVCKIPPTSLSLNKKTMTLVVGKSATITPRVLPDNATYKGVTYSTSNSNVARVSSAGTVTAVSIGSATITVKTKDGGLTATCFVSIPRRVTGVKLDRAVASVYKGLTFTLKATVLPADATYDSVSWSSSNTAVATVNSKGVVTGKALGAATITVKTSDGAFTRTCIVKVLQPVTSVRLNRTGATLLPNARLRLTATVLPSNAANKAVTWSSSNPSVATVDSSGNVTAKAPGRAVITVKTNCLRKTASCNIAVYQPVSGVRLNRTGANMYVGKSLQLTPTISPSNATNKTVKWSSSNTSVATVSSAGVITARAKGSAVITCTTNNGAKTAVCRVNVLQQVTSVSLNVNKCMVSVGKTYILRATVLPANANNKEVAWVSSNPAVASVSQSGVITAVGLGTAVITVKSVNNSKIATCTVTVIQPVVGITLDYAERAVTVGEEFDLTASVFPDNATNKSVTWQSSDSSVAEVSYGVVKAKGEGVVTITCTSVDGSFTATCVVTVGAAPAESAETEE